MAEIKDSVANLSDLVARVDALEAGGGAQVIDYEDYEALSEDEKNNGQYVVENCPETKTLGEVAEEVTALNNALANTSVYSTEEKVVGTWIDGKPLYRSVFQKSGLSFNGSYEWYHDLTNIDTVCSLRGLFSINHSTKPYIMFGSTVDNTVTSFLECNAEFFNIYISWGYNVTELIIIVEYTKTTD